VAKNKILITGAKGLIGQSLKNQLGVLGFQVKGIDNAYTCNHLEFGDIQDVELLKKLVPQCIGIVHLAGISRVISGEQNPYLCWNMNVEGTQKILEAAKNSPNNPWVIYASSREVYGQQDKLPVNEDAILLPLNVYARSKAAAEKLVLDYRNQGLQTAIIRFSNVYGSIDDYPDRVIPAFCKAAAYGGTIRIDGGHNTFDFTYIDDVTTGIIKVINKLQIGCFDPPPIHLTTGCGTTLLEAAELAKSLSVKPIKFLTAPSRSFDVSTFYGDTTRANRLLDWQAKMTIKEGMARLIKAFKDTAFIHEESMYSSAT
jgi:nucleoside-diphosphate-sugar epimerase